MTKPIYTEEFEATVYKDKVLVAVPHGNSPYRPMFISIDTNAIYMAMWDDEFGFMEKKFEYRDLGIMHKALTKIFGKKPKRKRKA